MSFPLADKLRSTPGFQPRLITALKGYNRKLFLRDLIAGSTVGIVALPLAMAFAIASGVKPEAGIFTAIIAGFIISALGGSRVQIGGPTGAFIVIVYDIFSKYGIQGLLVSTMTAGVLLVLMGLFKLGSVIKFIPRPVTMGFTSGIAVVILTSQIKDFMGLKIDQVPADFTDKVYALASSASSTNLHALALAVASFLLIWFWPKKWGRVVPASIVAVIAGTAFVALSHFPVETIGSKFGGIPQSLPQMKIPEINLRQVRYFMGPAFTIAFLAAIESLLSAVVADGMTDDRHDSNQELIAQGIANFFSPLFGGIPATGAIARTATNIKNGASTPIAGIVHALVLLLILLVAAPLAKFIPLATLSAVLIVVSINMGEWREFARLSRIPRSDALVFLAVFILTVLINLTVAVEVGMLLAMLLLLRNLSAASELTRVDSENDPEGDQHSLRGKEIPKGVAVFRMFGAFCFGAAQKFESVLDNTAQEPTVLIIRMRKVVTMDATGLNALESIYERLKRHGKALIISGPSKECREVMERAGFIDRIGKENVCTDIQASLARSRLVLSQAKNLDKK